MALETRRNVISRVGAWVAMLVVVYVTTMELIRAIGRDRLKEIFLGPGSKSARERYSRDAA